MSNDKTESPDVLLAREMGRFIYDPLGHVMFSYKWGEGELAGFDGPDEWQKEQLRRIGEEQRKKKFNRVDPVAPLRMATASGHGIGKSALTAWITNWIMDTRPFCKGTVTASTSPQLEGKTWSEIAKWRRRSIAAHWFKVSTGRGSMKMSRIGYEDSWYCRAETCREENSESFAGQHASNSTSFYIFDEASAVPDKIWEVAEGGLTDGEPMWLTFGNPTRNSGRFHSCFFGRRNRWITQQIDSRTTKMTNKPLIDEWIHDYGLDSDFVKVLVRGMFPSMSVKQFFSTTDLDASKGRHLREDQYNFAPVILTCDPAWEGDDELVIGLRQGLMFKVLKVMEKNDNDVFVAQCLANYEDQYKADAVFIDAGYGTGIKSAGIAMGRPEWHLVWFSGESPDKGYLNLRAYMYGQAKQWFKQGGAIENDDQLYNEALSIETVPRLDGKVQIEGKQALKKRSHFSPNRLDALVISFAQPVIKKVLQYRMSSDNMYQSDYDPLK